MCIFRNKPTRQANRSKQKYVYVIHVPGKFAQNFSLLFMVNLANVCAILSGDSFQIDVSYALAKNIFK